MPRRPDGRTARTAWLKVRITREGLAALDAARGATSRSTFVRDAVGHQIGRVTSPWTDTGDPHLAELLSSIFAWMAHAESERRSERTKAGLARRKAEGKPIGRREGAKDSKPRKRSGYVKRWENEREAKAS
jgi:hypothetical protein